MQSYAIQENRHRYPKCEWTLDNVCADLHYGDSTYDVVFTYGVLIHIPPEDIETALNQMYRISSKYLLFAEYQSSDTKEIKWHGKDEALWKAPFHNIVQTQFPGIKTIDNGVMGVSNEVHWYLYEK